MISPVIAAALLFQPVQAAPFLVSYTGPTQTFVNMATTYTAHFESGGTTIDHCRLSVDGVVQGDMTLSGSGTLGDASRSHSISSAGSHTIRVTCYNADESAVVYDEEPVTVFADSSGPAISPFSFMPASIVAGTAVTIQANYDDTDFGSGLQSCGLIVDDVESGLMTLSGGIGSTAGNANISYTFSSAGSHSVKVNCFDRSGNPGSRTQTVSVSASADTTPPTVGSLSYGSLILGSPITFQASVSDNVGVTSCNLNINGVYDGAMTISGGVASRSRTFTTAGTYSASARCFDAAGNSTEGPSVTFTFGSSDTVSPTVSSINPGTATVGSSVMVTASFTDNVGVTVCNLYVNSSLAGSMELSGTTAGTASRSHVFALGTSVLEVRCSDAAGNTGSTSRTIVGTSGSSYAGRLVKLGCPAGAVDVNHPCKAVYYVGSDGRRHAFPNEKVYFTWYASFDGIVDLDSAALAGIPLGSNVNYRPGIRMVKFTTLNRVYAVARYGQLRWVTSEAIATSLYGTDWNRKIDDINDAFYTDYTFGADITSAASYNPTAEASAATTIDANLR